jgi:hypothetical protein
VTQTEFSGPGWNDDPKFGDRLRMFSSDGYVVWSEDQEHADVYVGSMLIGMFERREPVGRNVILVGLCQGSRVRYGRVAHAFGMSYETLRQVRRCFAERGLEGLMAAAPRGGQRKLTEVVVQAVHREFAKGGSLRKVQSRLQRQREPIRLSVGTLSQERSKWQPSQPGTTEGAAATPSEPPAAEPPGGGSNAAQLTLPVPYEGPSTSAAPSASSAEPSAHVAPGSAATAPALAVQTQEAACETATASEAAPCAQPQDDTPVEAAVEASDPAAGMAPPIEGAVPQSGRFVQHLGTWLMIAMLSAMGLYARFEQERTRPSRQDPPLVAATVRVVLDALIVALAVGQRCIEGVRRLQTSTFAKLLRAVATPSASWVRRVLGKLAKPHGAGHIALGVAGDHLRAALAQKQPGRPVVLYLDNHLRVYTGRHAVRRAWRMQDRRARPGITDLWVHNERGDPVFRIDSPPHGSLTSLMPRATRLLRLALPDASILLGFDRGGAFPHQLAALRDEGMEFVTYERGPFERLPKAAFTHTLAFADDDVVQWCEAPDKDLKKGRGHVRRIAVLDADGRQINLLAISKQPAEWLIGVMRGRWCQENGFKHGDARWGQDQLDARKVLPCDPASVLPNPARRRLDHDLKLARAREGEALRQLARLAADAPAREKHERDLGQAHATQAKLLAERTGLPTHARLDQTELAGKLVCHDATFKLLVDAVRAACANAESALSARLAAHMKRPDEAKKLLANILTAPGEIRVHSTDITVVLDCAATRDERRAIASLLAEVTGAQLTLPGDPARRPLRFQSQPSAE